MSEANINRDNKSSPGQEVILELDGELASIFLGGKSDTVAILNSSRLNALKAILLDVSKNNQIKGLIIYGGSESIFCAGADINAIKGIVDTKVGEELARTGQEIFDLLDNLTCRTVAAISGACVGGGCELVLACDYRIAADLPQTKIGLPEVKLGILPGFGGTQRLPRLIGLPKALDIILKGKTLSAKQARAVGLVDEIVKAESKSTPTAALESAAREIALAKRTPQRSPISLVDKALTFTAIGRSVVCSKASKALFAETKGHYPAPPRALEISCRGLQIGMREGLREEARALGELIATPESKALVHLFFLTEGAGKLGKPAKADVLNTKAAVIGGGVMGSGIAAAMVSKSIPVVVYDQQEGARNKARGLIDNYLDNRKGLTAEDKTKLKSLVTITADIKEIKDAKIVIEAIVEDIKVKRDLFAEISKLVSADAVLASNTSSLSISQIASSATNPQRVIGMHFFNPAEKMPLVEIIRGEQTEDRAVIFTSALTSRLSKYPVVVEDVRGFLVNRILSPYMMEAAQILSEGYSVKAIDSAATKFGMPMGPLRLLDEVGLDVASKVAKIMIDAYGERMKGPRFAEQLVSLGRLGKKSGKGFYVHQGKDCHVESELRTLLDLKEAREATEAELAEIQERIILSMVNEAVLSLDEGVAGKPGRDAAGQIDLATVMGTGFAPFRGGVIFYANFVGAKTLQEKLTTLAKKYGSRFTPAPGISERAAKNKSFYE